MNWSVYRHISPSGKIYIGITSRKVNLRWRSNGSGYKNNPHLWSAIKKYGWCNFCHEVLYTNLDENEAKTIEIDLICYFESNNPKYGYNMTLGGEGMLGYSHSKETKNKLRLIHLGRHMSEDSREILRNKFSGVNNPSYGKVGSKNPRSKKIFQYTLRNELISVYGSSREAERHTNIAHQSISKCCNHAKSCKTAGGFIWRFECNEGDEISASILSSLTGEIEAESSNVVNQ